VSLGDETSRGMHEIEDTPTATHDAIKLTIDGTEYKGSGTERSHTITTARDTIKVSAAWEPNGYTRITRSRKLDVKGKNEVTLELKALAPTVMIDSQPQGATVYSADKAIGVTPLFTTTLPPSAAVTLTLKKNGYKDAELKLDVPGPGRETRVVQPLLVSDELARVRVTSEPSGAHIVRNGQLLAGVTTPAEILVEAGKPQRLMLTLPHHVPAVIEPFTPERGADGIWRVTLPIPPGNWSYSFVVDGKFVEDPLAQAWREDGFGGKNAVVRVD